MPRYQSQESQQQKRGEREFRHVHQHVHGHKRGQSSVTGARAGHAGKQQTREQQTQRLCHGIGRDGELDPITAHAPAHIAAARMQNAGRVDWPSQHIPVDDAVDAICVRPCVWNMPGSRHRNQHETHCQDHCSSQGRHQAVQPLPAALAATRENTVKGVETASEASEASDICPAIYEVLVVIERYLKAVLEGS